MFADEGVQFNSVAQLQTQLRAQNMHLQSPEQRSKRKTPTEVKAAPEQQKMEGLAHKKRVGVRARRRKATPKKFQAQTSNNPSTATTTTTTTAAPVAPQSGAVKVLHSETYRVHADMLRLGRKPLWLQALMAGVLLYVVFRLGYWLAAVVLTIFTVVLLLTVLFGKSFSARMAAFWLPKVMKGVDRKTVLVRQELMKHMSGRVLDLGSGSGENLKYALQPSRVGHVTHVTALEPNKFLHPTLHKVVQALPASQQIPVDVVGCFLDPLPTDPDSQFDFVILGNVLCEVPDPVSILQQLDERLAPGARIYFCEHVAHVDNSWRRKLQDRINPLWCLLSDGCNCNRPSVQWMEQHTNWELVQWQLPLGMTLIARWMVGVARKPTVQD
jgi:SAM-dependent methyltransferase